MDTKEFLKKHGIDYKVSLKPLACLKAKGMELEATQPVSLQNYSASVKEGTDKLFGIVNKEFTPIQNEQVISLVSKFLKDGAQSNYKFSSVRNGNKKSLLIFNPEQVEAVNEGDAIQSGIYISWKHDSGRGGVSLAPFFRRLVCDNGMVSDNISNKVISLVCESVEGYKKPEFRDEFLSNFIALKDHTQKALEKDAEIFKEWVGVKVSDEIALENAKDVFKITKLEEARNRKAKEDEKSLEKIFKKLNRAKAHRDLWFSRFKTQSDNKDNLWGLYNSFTAWFSHGLRSKEDRIVALEGVPRAVENQEAKVGLRASLRACNKIFKESVRV